MAKSEEAVARDAAKWHKRKNEWFAANGPCSCGSWDSLELHHVDPKTKIGHNVWSWAEERRNAELAKCVAKCRKCHTDLHAAMRQKHGIGGWKRGCRCENCLEAKRVEKRKYYARKVNKAGLSYNGKFKFV